MQSKKSVLIALVLVLLLGIGVGYYFGKRQVEEAKIPGKENSLAISEVKTGENEKALQKLDLLKSYTDFIFLPKEKIEDPIAFAEDMTKKVETIGDDIITAKYSATGESENKEQKIIDFLDFLNESIKADLSK